MRRNYRTHKAQLAAPLTARMVAELAPVTINAGIPDGANHGPPTFSALAYSGDPVSGATATPKLVSDFVLDLSGMTKSKNPKANLDHKSNQRVGHITEFVNDGKQINVVGALSAATVHRDEVAKSAADGYAWEVSIEAALSHGRKLAAGKTEIVNGRTVKGPLYIFAKSVLTDIGFVSHGANVGNEVTIAASAAGASKMGEFEKFVISCGADPETITDQQKATLTAAWESSKAGGSPNDGGRKSWKEVAEEEQRESNRQDRIIKLGRDALRDNPMFHDKINLAVEHAIEAKLSDTAFELELLRELRYKAGTFNARLSHGTAHDPKVIECAIAMASGLPNVEKAYSQQTLEAVESSGMQRGFSLQQLLMQVASMNGYSCRAGERIHTGNIRAVLEHCFPPTVARMAFSTVSLPNILGAVANKQILAGYMEEDPSWREIAQVKPVANFYTQNHYRMLDSLEYEEVGSGGEIKHGTLGEETYTSKAKTYGKMLGITRTQIINDDLGAFDDIRARLGRGAAKKFNNVFWAAFLDNSAFFTAALTNYVSGSTTNLGTDGVGLGLVLAGFRQMTTPSADGLKRVGMDLNPTKIIVPPELEVNALLAYRNTNLGAVASSAANIFQNRFRPVVQWRLSNSSYTGYSTTAFYVFGDTVNPMVASFLNGQQTPTVESTDADFDVLGIMFRGYHDFGCDKGEYLAGIKSKGAA